MASFLAMALVERSKFGLNNLLGPGLAGDWAERRLLKQPPHDANPHCDHPIHIGAQLHTYAQQRLLRSVWPVDLWKGSTHSSLIVLERNAYLSHKCLGRIVPRLSGIHFFENELMKYATIRDLLQHNFRVMISGLIEADVLDQFLNFRLRLE